MRFAVWAAVSTIEQVEGVSLDSQIQKSTERALSEGWIDTSLRYIADGYSRTGYVNLSDAEKRIPPLGDMLSDMRGGKFDILVVWNYDRLGDLIVMVATDFRNNKKQLFSLSQPTQIQNNYNPYMDDSSFIIQAFAPIWQRQRIADLRRKWEAGMPKRVRDGLPTGNLCFGYRAIEKNKPPEIVPAEAALVRMCYDLLMEGKSMRDIAAACNATGLKTKRGKEWTHTIVARMITNPFYMGVIEWRKVKVSNGKQTRNPVANRIIADGKHQPIYTRQEHEDIILELKRRFDKVQRSSYYYPFSGMLFCGKCGSKLYRGNFKLKDGSRSYVIREEYKRSCYTYKYDFIVQKIVDEIQRSSLENKNKRDVIATIKDYTAEIKDIESRIERVQQSAELGVYTPTQAAKRVGELQKTYEGILNKQKENERLLQYQVEFSDSFDELNQMGWWITNDEPSVVNRMLSSIIERIIINNGDVTVEWRTLESGA